MERLPCCQEQICGYNDMYVCILVGGCRLSSFWGSRKGRVGRGWVALWRGDGYMTYLVEKTKQE